MAGRRSERRAAPAPAGGRSAVARRRFTGRWREIGALALIVSAACVLHARSLGAPFFADDYLFLDAVRGRSFLSAVLSSDPIGNYWRPVGRQLYFWTVAALGESPAVAHGLNLLMLLATLALFHRLVRTAVGGRAAVMGTAFLAAHCVFDVPVLWASGSQDLMATLGAVASLYLLLLGRRGWAAFALLIGLLAKETIALTPLVGFWFVRREGEPPGRTLLRMWPLAAAIAVWVTLRLVMLPAGAPAVVSPAALPAALLHMLQVSIGAEWSPHVPFGVAGSATFAAALALLLIAVAVGATGGKGGEVPVASRRRWPAVGAMWALAGAIPVATVVRDWSAYQYMFAMCGVALMLGCLLQRRTLIVALAVVLACAWGSERARRMETFATQPDAWSTQSHVNPHYLLRSMGWVSRLLGELRSLRPSLPPRSTLFFSGVPAFVAWQTADGPLIRWAYRDTTLRSFYLSDWTTRRAERGPVFVFVEHGGVLDEVPQGTGLFRYVALTQALSDHHRTAREAADLGLERHPDDPVLAYWAPWLAYAAGDEGTARAELAAGGFDTTSASPRVADTVRRSLAAGDSLSAVRLLTDAIKAHVLDPRIHALAADVILAGNPRSPGGLMETLIARLLAPGDPVAWRRWAGVQIETQHPQQAQVSLNRYFELAGPEGARDEVARRLQERLDRSRAGGALVQRGLRRVPAGSR